MVPSWVWEPKPAQCPPLVISRMDPLKIYQKIVKKMDTFVFEKKILPKNIFGYILRGSEFGQNTPFGTFSSQSCGLEIPVIISVCKYDLGKLGANEDAVFCVDRELGG